MTINWELIIILSSHLNDLENRGVLDASTQEHAKLLESMYNQILESGKVSTAKAYEAVGWEAPTLEVLDCAEISEEIRRCLAVTSTEVEYIDSLASKYPVFWKKEKWIQDTHKLINEARIPWIHKPFNLKEVRTIIKDNGLSKLLPIFTIHDLFANESESVLENIFKGKIEIEVPQYFICLLPDGERLLGDTQGFNYIFSAVRLEGLNGN